ncbi:hypothetical protein KY285_023660 [Solanum tuberosum]|nr:hypothetical protein KY289_023991 [Solanum tuberosum]KAH0675859.1 hypothetical protein KY285_023660 [Solanum tuberosum]
MAAVKLFELLWQRRKTRKATGSVNLLSREGDEAVTRVVEVLRLVRAVLLRIVDVWKLLLTFLGSFCEGKNGPGRGNGLGSAGKWLLEWAVRNWNVVEVLGWFLLYCYDGPFGC